MVLDRVCGRQIACLLSQGGAVVVDKYLRFDVFRILDQGLNLGLRIRLVFGSSPCFWIWLSVWGEVN